MQEPNNLRVVLVGKSGCGKSSLANTILGGPIFKGTHGSSDSKIRGSEAHSKVIDGRTLTVVDTPGIFNTGRATRELQCEIISCLTLCAPGPHAVLLVLSVERFTAQEQAVVDLIKAHFGDDLFQFTTVVFTHGDQLPENVPISEFVQESRGLRELVRACGGRCHVVDNKYWRTPQEDPHRTNAFQVKEILASVEGTVRDNQGYFTNEMLLRVEREIQAEQSRAPTDAGLSLEESREWAKTSVLKKYMDEAIKPDFAHCYVKYVIAAIVGVAAVFVAPKVIKFVTKKLLILPSPVLPVAPPVSIAPPLPTAPPLTLPIAQPTAPPLNLPIAPPLTLPIAQPTAPPLNLPIALPTAPPITPPIAPPLTQPIAPPLTLPIAPFSAPPVEKVAGRLESILTWLEELYNKTYDPHNPFN